jgi:hypothetical protein
VRIELMSRGGDCIVLSMGQSLPTPG